MLRRPEPGRGPAGTPPAGGAMATGPTLAPVGSKGVRGDDLARRLLLIYCWAFGCASHLAPDPFSALVSAIREVWVVFSPSLSGFAAVRASIGHQRRRFARHRGGHHGRQSGRTAAHGRLHAGEGLPARLSHPRLWVTGGHRHRRLRACLRAGGQVAGASGVGLRPAPKLSLRRFPRAAPLSR
jgi:hypothetical protein